MNYVPRDGELVNSTFRIDRNLLMRELGGEWPSVASAGQVPMVGTYITIRYTIALNHAAIPQATMID